MITERRIEDFASLAHELNSLPNHYIYRGQADAQWELTSTLERFLNSQWSSQTARKFENYSLDKFKSKYHIYCGSEHQPQSKLAWLSVMQHYGIPTRLIDFTESPYIALYFALESYIPNQGKDLAIFAVDYTAVMNVSLDHIASRDTEFKYSRKDLPGRQDSLFENFVDRHSYDLAWVTEPDQLNARIDRQCGTFLVSGNLESTIGQVICSQKYEKCDIIKFIIPAHLHESIYIALRKMNINSKIIYGDLAGLAQSIKMELQIYTY